MDLIFHITHQFFYVHEEIFWLKEFLTTLQSGFVFLLVWWIVRLDHKIELLLYLSAFIGIACVFFGDMEFWSDNDILKFVAPGTLFLLLRKNDRENNALFFAFLIPYFITSYEFHRSFFHAACSLSTHIVIIALIILVKNNTYLTYAFSIIIGVLFNHIGYISSPGTSEILVNPALISFATKGLEIYRKNYRYTEFLQSFWFTLLCFAYFGSWIFYFTQQIFQFIRH